MATETVVSTRDLRKAYRGSVALDGVSLDVRRGETFALLGPNGAGKTTLTEILEGLRDRDSGTVDVLGEDPGRAGTRWRTRVGVVLQEANDYANLTVAEVLRHFATFYPNGRDPDELMAAVGLEEQRNQRARQLSGGQRRRLDVALGLIGRPSLLFLDEPTTGFDPQARHQFWDLIGTLHAEGTTILLTTHYLDEAEHLADRIGVLAGGRLVDVDTPAGLGGRNAAEASVSWVEDDRSRAVLTDNPTATVVDLAARFDGDIPALTVTRPSLEDIYLRMIGENR